MITLSYNRCSNIVAACGTTAAHVVKDKLKQLNKQVFRVVLDDQSSTPEELLRKLHAVTLEQGRVQNMLVTVYKCLTGVFTNLFTRCVMLVPII